MNDRDERFDRDLTAVLREIAGEEAPMSLRYRLSDITERAPIGRQSWFVTPMRLSVVVAGLAVLALALLFWPRADVGPGPSESPSPSQGQSQSVEPSATAEPTPTLVPSAEQPTTAPTIAPTPVPTTAPSPTPAPVPTAVPSGAWTGLTWSDPVTPQETTHLYDILRWGDGYVAGGRKGSRGAALFASPDGRDWTVVGGTGVYVNDPGINRWPEHLVVLDGEVLAFSNVAAWDSPGYDGPIIWGSKWPDRRTWGRVDSDDWAETWAGYTGSPSAAWLFEQQPIEWGLADVAAGPAGVVVIGNWLVDDSMVPIMLHSGDGRTWTAVALPSGSVSPVLNAITEHDGRFVVTGATGIGPDPTTATAAAWYSDDGITWLRATVDLGDFPVAAGFEFGPLWAGDDGLLACSGSRSMFAGGWRYMTEWLSTDGASWRLAPNLDENPGCSWAAADGSRIIALGPRPGPPEWPGITHAWSSRDGLTWQPLTVEPVLTDMLERFWVVPDGVIYAGEESFWFGTPTFGP